eukprot:506499_1
MSPPQTLFVYLVLIVNYLSSVIGESIYCNNTYECVGNQLVVSGSDDIYGRGYKSIFGTNTSITGYVVCSGAFGCAQTLFIFGNSIQCNGAGSCANI